MYLRPLASSRAIWFPTLQPALVFPFLSRSHPQNEFLELSNEQSTSEGGIVVIAMFAKTVITVASTNFIAVLYLTLL